MNKMTFQEIISLCKEMGLTPQFLFDDCWRENVGSDEEKEIESKLQLLGDVIYISSNIVDTDSYECTTYLPDHDLYIQVFVYYSSYEGRYWDGLEFSNIIEVTPVEKTVTVYERKKS